MALKKDRGDSSDAFRASATVDELMLAALERGDDSFQTGRYLVTFKDGAAEEGIKSLQTQGMRLADARDFTDQAVTLEDVGDADTVTFPEIGVALVSGTAAQEHNMTAQLETATDSLIESVDPEYFVFADQLAAEFMTGITQAAEGNSLEYMRGFLRAAEMIAKDLNNGNGYTQMETEEEVMVSGATWGMNVCKVPQSLRTGVGIRVAVLDTGFDLGHPDFTGRQIISKSFVGQPVQDLHGHGTHCMGTACGPKAPVGSTPRYGTGHRSSMFVGKVLTNSGTGSMGGVLAGMNWAIANRCPVISMSLGSPAGIQPAYTQAGQAALNNGCLIIAAAGNSYGKPTGAPANSPTIMSVAALDQILKPAAFSNMGKIDISGPGVNVFSSWPRPRRYNTLMGTSMATPHVAGCAALWAETSNNLRGMQLWRKLQATAKRLPFPPSKVGAGLVQAP